MDEAAKLIGAIAAVLWPIIVLLLLRSMLPLLESIVASARTRQITVKLAGQEFTLAEATERQVASVTDLMAQVGQLQHKVSVLTAAAPPSRQIDVAPSIRRVLWVDDNPENNRLYVAQLQEVGFVVDVATATSGAISKLEAIPYDAVISDMGRTEQGTYNSSAGVDLVQAVRERNHTIPIIVFCSTEKARTYGEAARAAGATDVTSSPVRLLAELGFAERRDEGAG